MANELKMANVSSIRTLHEQGLSNRQIARLLGVHRETVARYVRGGSKPANAPVGSGESKPAIAPPGSREADEPNAVTAEASAIPDPEVGRRSDCEPWRQLILQKLELGLSAQRIYQDLQGEQDGDQLPIYYSVRRFVRGLERSHGRPMRRMECEPGGEAQVDFGQGGVVVQSNGRRRRPHVLRIVLSHSRKAYSEVVDRQTTENFIRCLENAFHHFGGVPRRLVLDNLRAAVTKADWFDPELNPKFQTFCDYYRIVPLPTKPRTPRHKGKIERSIGYVKDNGLKARSFGSLLEQNQHLLQWETSVADKRVHGTTRKQVQRVFEEVERPTLQTIPSVRFPVFEEERRSVHRDGHVEVAKSYYSVPPEYLGHRLWVRWDTHMVRIYNHRMEQIAVHVRQDPGQFSTNDRHILSEKMSGVERGGAWLLRRVGLIGPHTTSWAQDMLAARGIQGLRVLQGLLSLADKHPPNAVERACEVARSHGAHRLRTIRELIKKSGTKQQEFEFTSEHDLIRPLATYEQFIHDSITQDTHS